MSFSVSIYVDTSGLDKIAARLDSTPQEITKRITGMVEAEAKILAPVDTHALQNSIKSEFPGGNIWGRVNVWQEYGLYQELGFFHKWRTRGKVQWVQNPFLIPAFEHQGKIFLSPSTWAPIFQV